MRLQIEARDPAREAVGIVTGWTEAHLVARHNDVGTWSITLPLATTPPAILEAWAARGAAGVRIVDEDQPGAPPIITGPVTSEGDTWGAASPHGGHITVSGVSDMTLLGKRLIYADPTVAWSAQDETAYRRVPSTGFDDAETVIRTLVLESLGSTALIARRITGFTAEANLTRGGQVRSATINGTGLLARVQRLALLGGLGFRVDQETTGALTLRFYEPTLRVNVLLSPMTGTVLGGTASVEAPTATRALVAGQGSCVELGDADLELEWGRTEVLVDQKSTSDADDLDQAAAEALAAGGARGAWQADVQDGTGAVYGVDYGLGDRVGIDVRGTEVRDVVREVKIDVTSEGTKVGPVVGPEDASSAPPLYRQVKAIRRRLDLQGG